MVDARGEHQTALVAALLELDRHLGGAGWDQPTRLFALVGTDELAVAEPGLAAQLGLRTSDAAAQIVASHPERQEIRVVVGVDRSGNRHGVARLASRPEELLGAEDLVPGLAAALAHTLT